MKEFKMYHPQTKREQYISRALVNNYMSNGWILHMNESRESADTYQVADIYEYFGEMSMGILPKIPLIKYLFFVHYSYSENMNWMDIVWGTMTLGKLPSVSWGIFSFKKLLKSLTTVGKFMIALTTCSPLAFVASWVIVQALIGS